MARIRTIKPEFWRHPQLGRLSPLARLTFIGMMSLADDEGRGRANTDQLWGELHGESGPNTRRWWRESLRELRRVRDDKGPLVVFYKVAGAEYYWLPGFKRQQYIEKSQPSKLPPPPNSGNAPRPIPPDSPLEGIRDIGSGIKEGGGEQGGEDPAISAFDFCQSPGPKAKLAALADLRRQQVTDEAIIASAKDPARQTWDFFDHIRALRPINGTPKNLETPF